MQSQDTGPEAGEYGRNTLNSHLLCPVTGSVAIAFLGHTLIPASLGWRKPDVTSMFSMTQKHYLGMLTYPR